MDELFNSMDELDEYIAKQLEDSGLKLGKAQIKYLSGHKCITIEMEATSTGEKGLLIFLDAPGSDYSFVLTYGTYDTTSYDYTGAAKIFDLIKDAKYVG